MTIEREILIMQQAHHENVLGLIGAFAGVQRVCIVMELMTYGSLDLGPGKTLSPKLVVYVAHSVRFARPVPL